MQVQVLRRGDVTAEPAPLRPQAILPAAKAPPPAQHQLEPSQPHEQQAQQGAASHAAQPTSVPEGCDHSLPNDILYLPAVHGCGAA